MFSGPIFVLCRNVLCKILFSSNNVCPLSMIIVIGLPVSAINPMIALRQLSLSNFGTTSICTSITVRHVNRQPNLFYFLRPIPTDKGRNQSARKIVKAAELSKHFLGRSTIIALIVCALLFLQVTHFLQVTQSAPYA